MTYDATILADNPIAFWECRETSGLVATDATSSGYNGALSGTISYNQSGPIVGATDPSLLFAPGSLSLPYSLNPSTWSALTLEYWIKITGGWQYMVVEADNIIGTTLFLNTIPTTPPSGSGDSILTDIDVYWSGTFQNAYLSKVAIYNYKLTPLQMLTHYNTALGLSVTGLFATVGNATYQIAEDKLASSYSGQPYKTTSILDTRAQHDFTIVDTGNLASFTKGEAVIITDTTLGTLFNGSINTATLLNIVPQPYSLWDIACVDNSDKESRRTSNNSYTNQYSGAIAVDQGLKYLAPEGVVMNAAERIDTTNTDFNAGTLSNTVGTLNVGDGDLELALAGSTVNISQGPITFPSTSAIKMTAVMNDANLPTTVTPQVQMKIWSGSYTIVSGDVLTFDVWCDGSSAQQIAGVDFVCTDGTQFSALGGDYTDGQFLGPIVNNQGGLLDLTGLAVNTWYTRQFQIGSSAIGVVLGKTIQYASVAFYGAKPGNYTAYVRNASIFNGMTTKVTFFGATTLSFQTSPQVIQNTGYASASTVVSIVTAYNQSGSVQSSSVSLSPTSIARSSFLSWTQTNPTNETLAVSASLDGGITFLPCTLNSAIPGLLPGMNLSGKTLILQYAFTNKGTDPTVIPQFTALVGNVQPSYVATKSDVVYSASTQANWNAGTLTNLTAPSSNVLQLTGSARNWDDANYSNQTLYGTDTVNGDQIVLDKQFELIQLTLSADIRSQFNFAGQFQNFTAEIDVMIDAIGDQACLIYRTTGWINGANSFAYLVFVDGTKIEIGKGTNGGGTTYTTIANTSLTLTVNQRYHLKVVVNGNTHQVYLNDVPYLNVSDSTYPSAGYLGVRYLNNTATAPEEILFDNFGIVAALSGTWVSPAIDIHSLGTIQGSELIVQSDPNNASFASVLAEISLNNGSTWATCNDARQTSLTSALASGTSYTSLGVKALQAAIPSGTSLVIAYGTGTTQTVTTSAAAAVGATLISVTSFSASANFGVGLLVVPSSPLSTSNGLTVPGLTNGTNVSGMTQVKIRVTISTTSASTGAAMPDIQGITLLVMGAYSSSGTRTTAPLGIDTMVRANQSGFGTAFDGQTWAKTGTGTDAIASNEATITNTTGDVHERLGSSTGTDLDATVRAQVSASGTSAGIELRYTASNNWYRLAFTVNSLTLTKDVAGTSSPLGSSTLTITAGTYYRLRFRIQGTALYARIWQDGTLEPTLWNIQAIDSSIASGGFALFANGAGTASFDHFRVTQYPDPALSLAPVVSRLGDSLVGWNANVATNTTLAVSTSLDGVNFNTATSGTSITGLTPQPTPTIDTFGTNTSANYTSTNITGGATATVTYDTTNSRITLAGGTGALYLNSSISCSDVDLLCDMDESDAGGLVWREVDTGDYYELGVYDDHSSGGFTNKLRLYKVSSGTRSLLGSQSTISFARSTSGVNPYHRIRVTMLGAIISVYFDGTLMQTYTDGSPLGAGKCGLRNDGGTSRYYQLRIQPQGQIVTGSPSTDTVTGTFVYTKAALTSTDPTVTPQLLDLTTLAHNPNIGNGVLIPQADYISTYVNNNLDDLAKKSNYYTLVDNNNNFIFQQRTATPAPWLLSQYDPLVQNIQIVNSSDVYSNRQVLRGVVDTVSFSNAFAGNGQSRSFACGFLLTAAPTITLNGQAQTVGLKGTTGSQYYYAVGDATIAQDASQTLLQLTDTLIVSGLGTATSTVTRNSTANQAALAAIEGTGTGIIEAVTDVSALGLNTAAANAYGDQLNARQGIIGRTFTFTTERTGLAIGQMLPVFIPIRNILNAQLLVLEVDTSARMISTGSGNAVNRYIYSITASENYNVKSWQQVLLNVIGGGSN